MLVLQNTTFTRIIYPYRVYPATVKVVVSCDISLFRSSGGSNQPRPIAWLDAGRGRLGDTCRITCRECSAGIQPPSPQGKELLPDRGIRGKHGPGIQLDLLDPDDGYYEHSAIVTNKAVIGWTRWYFMCGHGTHEKVCGELKGGFAFDCRPAQRYRANGAWQVFSILAST